MPRLFGPDGIARDTRNAMRLPQEVEPLGGFLGEADDALGEMYSKHWRYFITYLRLTKKLRFMSG